MEHEHLLAAHGIVKNCMILQNSPLQVNLPRYTQPDSCNRLRIRSHIMQYRCGYLKLELQPL